MMEKTIPSQVAGAASDGRPDAHLNGRPPAAAIAPRDRLHHLWRIPAPKAPTLDIPAAQGATDMELAEIVMARRTSPIDTVHASAARVLYGLQPLPDGGGGRTARGVSTDEPERRKARGGRS